MEHVILEARTPATADASFAQAVPLVEEDRYMAFHSDSDGSLTEIVIRMRLSGDRAPEIHRNDGKPHFIDKETKAYDEIFNLHLSLEGSFFSFTLSISSGKTKWTWYQGDNVSQPGTLILGNHGSEYQLNQLMSLEQSVFIFCAKLGADKPRQRAMQALGMQSNAKRLLFKEDNLSAIWRSLLFIEMVCAGGRFKKAHVVAECVENPHFQRAHSELPNFIKGDIISQRLSKEYFTTNYSNEIRTFAAWIFDKRGFYFHQSVKRKTTWKFGDRRAQRQDAFIIVRFAQILSAYFFQQVTEDPTAFK